MQCNRHGWLANFTEKELPLDKLKFDRTLSTAI